MNFHVMQPGSSVATSLVPGEAVPKHVAILSVTGREFKSESIRLKTVRPFIMKELVLHEEKEAKALAKKENNRTQLTQYLMRVVEGLIADARAEWAEAQAERGDGASADDDDADDEAREPPLPLIRLRVEYSSPEGGQFDCENPQRFSNRFVGRVANVNDVVQFYRKKAGANAANKKGAGAADMPEDSVLAQLSLDNVRVEKLVREFLTAQSLTILPQNSFGDAVSQFVDKDDKHAMEMFVNESLANQIKHLMDVEGDEDDDGDDDLVKKMDRNKSRLEELFAKGHLKEAAKKKRKLKPRPENWDSDLDGNWSDEPGAYVGVQDDADGAEEDDADEEPQAATSRRATTATGRGRGGRGAGTASARGKKATTARTRGSSSTAAASGKRGAPARGAAQRKQRVVGANDDEDEDEDEPDGMDVAQVDDESDDVVMLSDNDNDLNNDDHDHDHNSLFVSQHQPSPAPPARKRAAPARTTKRTAPAPAPARQTRLTFASQQSNGTASQVAARGARPVRDTTTTPARRGNGRAPAADEIMDDDEDDDDAFEPAPSHSAARGGRRGRR